MKDSNIDVDIIDETLLYICINGNREHISVDNARIKYAKHAKVLTMIDDVLAKYKENSEPLATVAEDSTPAVEAAEQSDGIKDLNDMPLDDVEFEIDLGDLAQKDDVAPSLKDLNDKPLETPSAKEVHTPDIDSKEVEVSLEDLNNAPLGLVDEAKFASIYSKYNSRIRETFPTDSPSFLDVEKLASRNKPLEQVK